jgi:hypothetical protein
VICEERHEREIIRREPKEVVSPYKKMEYHEEMRLYRDEQAALHARNME